MRKLIFFYSAALLLGSSPCLYAWDYPGHRAVNQIALEALPPDFPKFVKTAEARERIAFLSGEPDRWRNSEELPFIHVAFPDHQIDLELLAEVDYTPETLPEFRDLFLGHCLMIRQQHPERFPPLDVQRDKDHTREIIGTLPWAIVEYYGKLRSAFAYLKAYEEHGGTPDEIANAQANVVYVMGVIGHYVGDAGQPLHTTKSYNGWVGPNPKGFTTARTFHAWIDGGFLKKTGELDLQRLGAEVKPARVLSNAPDASGRGGIFSAVITFIVDQNKSVEPLYALEKSGKLNAENPESKEGRAFLESQIVKSGHLLSSLWLTAWYNTPPDKFLIGKLSERQMQ